MSDCLNILLQVIYRIKLPGSVILGEGKPENQNHAIIFTRGEVLQTIDMNQVPQANIYIWGVYVSGSMYVCICTLRNCWELTLLGGSQIVKLFNRLTIWKKPSK